MADDVKNAFISHIHEDDAGLEKLKELISRNGLTVRDYSITRDKPNNAKSEEYIKYSVLAPQIDQCSVLIVYITPDTKDSAYVNWEIEYANKQDKQIVGVWAWGENGCDLPEALDNYADAVVGWNGNNVIDAINAKIDGFEAPDGAPRGPRPLKRHPC